MAVRGPSSVHLSEWVRWQTGLSLTELFEWIYTDIGIFHAWFEVTPLNERCCLRTDSRPSVLCLANLVLTHTHLGRGIFRHTHTHNRTHSITTGSEHVPFHAACEHQPFGSLLSPFCFLCWRITDTKVIALRLRGPNLKCLKEMFGQRR